MPYDKSLDVESFKQSKEFGDNRITIGVFSYNGGEKKLQLSRETKTANEEWQFVKLGRLNKQEAKEIIPIIMKAAESM